MLRLLQENKSFLALRAGGDIEVTHVLVKSPNKPRVSECKKEWITTDPDVIFNDPRVDVVVEVMGGEHPAFDYIERAIAAGKGVVTANKLLIAKHGPELVEKGHQEPRRSGVRSLGRRRHSDHPHAARGTRQ